jgi:Ca2+-binding RTX toxin-like protein
MSVSPSRLMAAEVPCSSTESICIIFKEIDSISIVMQRESVFSRKITNFIAKTINTITTVSAPAIIVPALLLLSLPALGFVSVWADNFFGTSGPDTIVGTDDDDKIFGKKGSDNVNGKGGDDYIAGNAGDDEINDGFGSDKIIGGSGDDTIQLVGVSGDEGAEGVDKAYGGKGKDNINADSEEGSFLLYGGWDDDTIVGGDGGGKIQR